MALYQRYNVTRIGVHATAKWHMDSARNRLCYACFPQRNCRVNHFASESGGYVTVVQTRLQQFDNNLLF